MSSNHVTFDENPHAQPEAGPSTSHSAGPSIHPDRLALNAIPVEVKKSKNKSEAQKNREKKKLKKRRKIEKAKKASAPKTNKKEWKPDPVLEALKKSTTNNAVTNLSNGIDEKQSLQKDEGGDEDGEKKVDGTINGESEREKRRREKREKRERRERKEKRKLEREAKLSAASTSALPETKSGVELQDQQEDVPMEEDSQPASVEQHDDEVGSDDEEEKGEDQAEKQPSPEPLEAFPLPRSAPAPAPEILAKQGLPSGLEDAEFIDQSLRIGLDDLKAPVKTVLGEVKEIKTISERMKGKLRETGVEDLFAVQAAILPHLLSLRLNPLPYDRLHDYLISAPTGSGKTLAYAIPIIEILSQRITTRLRALIVLPTRDLVIQVRETLEVLAKGTGLNIGAVTGQHSFTQEQSQLVADMETPLLGGSSKLDILIATPGRLIDHLQSTPNFTLQHLRFLIIDEADRLLNQSFQNWLSQVLSYINPPDPPRPLPEGFLVQPWDKVAPSWMEGLGLIDRKEEWNERPPVTCQKLLFSATLTRDPSKVAALSLTSPKYYIIQSTNLPSIPYNIGETFSFPSTLSEKMLILPSALKPLNLIHLIYSTEFGISNGLIFTKSVESSQRLLNLLQFFNDAFISGGKKVVVKGYTGELKSSERKRILSDFSEGKINLLVCSDLIARGMDLPSVANVISYDVPLDMRKYVHRVGRTARAGREGTAWTLVEKQEALHFKGMMKTAGHLKAIRKVKVKEDDLSDYKESYEIAMKRLKEFYGRDT
ncbi:ATP-dependent RNA helicase DDX51/DBP6 [Kwoniella mangroviensis CBS 8886]|nr:ATP-dependent RNA helicase DDX51/DBP6 [Kwoniella mangroviensis CBS 8886]